MAGFEGGVEGALGPKYFRFASRFFCEDGVAFGDGFVQFVADKKEVPSIANMFLRKSVEVDPLMVILPLKKKMANAGKVPHNIKVFGPEFMSISCSHGAKDIFPCNAA